MHAPLDVDTIADVVDTLPTYRSVLQAMNVAVDAPVEGNGDADDSWLQKLTSWI